MDATKLLPNSQTDGDLYRGTIQQDGGAGSPHSARSVGRIGGSALDRLFEDVVKERLSRVAGSPHSARSVFLFSTFLRAERIEATCY